MPSLPGVTDAPEAPPCVCSGPGWCERYRRHMMGYLHAACAGDPAFAHMRDSCLADFAIAVETAPEPDPGGLGLAHNAYDHFALSFAKAGTMALHDAEGDADRSLAGRWPGTWYYLGGGPSLAAVDLGRLAGRQTLAVNSVTELFLKPTVWLAVDAPDDPPDRYRGVPWKDAEVVKLLPRGLAGHYAGASDELVCDQPNTRFFLRNARFDAATFLTERTVNWGCDPPWGSGRSVMLAALKLLWYLGACRVVLLGCDWHMDPARPYAHSAGKDAAGCESNNRKFAILEQRFRQLAPVLDCAGMPVVNATEGSRLEAFPQSTLDYELANEGLFRERRTRAMTVGEKAQEQSERRAALDLYRRAWKAIEVKGCRERGKECNCFICLEGRGDMEGGHKARPRHCLECVKADGLV